MRTGKFSFSVDDVPDPAVFVRWTPKFWILRLALLSRGFTTLSESCSGEDRKNLAKFKIIEGKLWVKIAFFQSIFFFQNTGRGAIQFLTRNKNGKMEYYLTFFLLTMLQPTFEKNFSWKTIFHGYWLTKPNSNAKNKARQKRLPGSGCWYDNFLTIGKKCFHTFQCLGSGFLETATHILTGVVCRI